MAGYQPFDGPIPGENFTSDTKNYPWHRPPEYTNIDDGIQAVIDKVMDEEASDDFLTMIEIGFSIKDVAQLLIMSGIGAGKWTPDFGLLMAGPVAHVLVLMCKGYGLEYDLGIEPAGGKPTKTFFRAASKIDKAKAEQVSTDLFGDDTDAPDQPDQEPAPAGPPEGGLGSPPPAVGEAPPEQAPELPQV